MGGSSCGNGILVALFHAVAGSIPFFLVFADFSQVSFMVCEVRPIPAENKCELWLKFNFDNKLERELSTELGAGAAMRHTVFTQIEVTSQIVATVEYSCM